MEDSHVSQTMCQTDDDHNSCWRERGALGGLEEMR